MARIVPKLNLNKTPQLAENNSLIFAKNIKLDKYGIIEGDSSVKPILDRVNTDTNSYGYIGQIVGVNNKVYFFVKNYEYEIKIVDSKPVKTLINSIDTILEYDEVFETLTEIDCNWSYHGGKITGCVTTNNTNEAILTICEYDAEIDVPIKHINLSRCSKLDDESIYTQSPNIPISNMTLTGMYSKTIPNGVYMFFIRYKIRDNFYTEWFPCSKECFAGTPLTDNTIQGTLKHIQTERDSSTSFVFEVEHLFPKFTSIYKEFQIGFILSHDDALVARSWKSFEFPKYTQLNGRDKGLKQTIHFDYDKDSIEEIDIDTMLRTNYELFNVRNITPFKNKLYAANYKETDFNPSLQDAANDVQIDIVQKGLNVGNKFIDGKELNEPDSTGTYYTKYGDLSVSTLYNSNKYLVSNKILTQQVNKGTVPLYRVHIHLDQDSIDPDVMWIDKIEAPTDSNRSTSGNDFSFQVPIGTNDWKAFFYSIGSKYEWVDNRYRNNSNIHPLVNTGLDKRWYYASSSKGTPFNEAEPGDGIVKSTDNGRANYLQIWNNGFGPSGSLQSSTAEKLVDNVINYIKSQEADKAILYLDVNTNGGTFRLLGVQNSTHESNTNHLTDGVLFSNSTYQQLEARIESEILNQLCGVDAVGNFYINTPNGVFAVTSYTAKIAEYEYTHEKISIGNGQGVINESVDVLVNKTIKTLSKSFAIDSKYINNSGEFTTQYRSLMPFTDYEFYIHYVAQNGIPTNGYYIGTKKLERFNTNSAASIIYPKFSDINIPTGYVSYFISIYKTGDTVCQLFNVIENDNSEITADCLEADALLESINNNISICDSEGTIITNVANYYPSGTTNPEKWFGNNGTVVWNKDDANIQIYYSPIIKVSVEFKSVYNVTNPAFLSLATIINGAQTVSIVGTAYGNTANSFANQIITEVKRNQAFINKIEDISFIVYTKNGAEYVEFIFVSKSIKNKQGLSDIQAIGFGLGANQTIANDMAVNNIVYANIVTPSYWVRIPVDKSNVKPKRLTKLTPYLTVSSYNNYETLNSPGFLNTVYKTDKTVSNAYYCSGTDVYEIDRINGLIKLGDLFEDSIPPIFRTNYSYVLSNYPLNFISLSEDITNTIKSIKIVDPIDSTESYERFFIKYIQTLVSSSIYELPHMYYDYNKKYYNVYNKDNNLISFDNTIRSSDIDTDDVYRNIYRFNALDYYNIPTNRGIIINLFGINSNIYVHTEHSLYEFKGMNTFNTENGEAALKEGDIFETGITDLFDSQYGFGGLQVKSQSLVTFLNYIFYDGLANEIYAYDSHSTPVIISKPIAKLMKNYNFTDIKFAADNINERIFINLIGIDSNVCLSYNTTVKSFVSIHDISFDDVFNSRVNLYFVKINENDFTIYRKTDDEQNKFGKLTRPSYLNNKDMKYDTKINNDTRVESSVDVIYNQEFDYMIKNLEYIQFICNAKTTYQNSDICMAEDVTNHIMDWYAGDKLRIYSDQGFSELIPFTDNSNSPIVSNNYKLLDSTSYTKPRFNNGVWSFNYFRNVKYNSSTSKQYQQEDSLLVGKYIVARFIFNPKFQFKLENINFKVNNYGKI